MLCVVIIISVVLTVYVFGSVQLSTNILITCRRTALQTGFEGTESVYVSEFSCFVVAFFFKLALYEQK